MFLNDLIDHHRRKLQTPLDSLGMDSAKLADQEKLLNSIYSDDVTLTLPEQSQGTCLLYGEIEYTSFAAILATVNKIVGPEFADFKTFYDIGCGRGKPVFAAAMLYDNLEAIGVEMVGSLIQQAESALSRAKKSEHASMSALQRVRFLEADCMTQDYSNADIIFANSTAFDFSFMKQLAAALSTVTEGLDIRLQDCLHSLNVLIRTVNFYFRQGSDNIHKSHSGCKLDRG